MSVSATPEHSMSAPGMAAGFAPDHHLAGLVEAATAAAGKDMTWRQSKSNATVTASQASRDIQDESISYERHCDYAVEDGPLHNDICGPSVQPQSTAPASSPRETSHTMHRPASPRKRRRSSSRIAEFSRDAVSQETGSQGNLNVDPAMDHSLGAPSRPAQHSDADRVSRAQERAEPTEGREILSVSPASPTLTTPQPGGGQSAFALFRKPTAKKHTRPPMANLYASLQLSPEGFVHLQAAAKAFMLDPEHPERRECVGQRGRGDSEIVKLRLYNCVRDFLGPHGNGVRYFGEHADTDGAPRTMMWPRDEQNIIALVMPLLRRMVTNERQRQYAIETRKGGAEKMRRQRMRREFEVPSPSEHSRPTPMHAFSQSLPTFTGGFADPEMARLFAKDNPTDCASIASTYDLYNVENQLDRLASETGLSTDEWKSLVAIAVSHYNAALDTTQPYAQLHSTAELEATLIDLILTSERFAHARWRGSQGEDNEAVEQQG
ncbi:hypothetical protein KEM55_007838 [Ascosphaera atra]|nr:hypothetical protein KEM55_007838 [Ascosphaera atra]